MSAIYYIRWNTGKESTGLTELEMYKTLWERTGTTDEETGLSIEPREYGKMEGSEDDDLKEQLDVAREEYRKMLGYAIDGVKHRLWKTAFDLNRPELSGPMAQEIVFNLQQMAADLAEYETEAARLEGAKE